RKNCHDFVGIISDRLSGAHQQPTLNGIRADIGTGVGMSSFDCFKGERSEEAMIANFESYTACMVSQTRNPERWHLDGSAISSNYTGSAPNVPGYHHVSSTESARSGPNGNSGTEVRHEYANDSGGTMSITNYSMIVDGKEDYGTFVTTDDGKGNTH